MSVFPFKQTYTKSFALFRLQNKSTNGCNNTHCISRPLNYTHGYSSAYLSPRDAACAFLPVHLCRHHSGSIISLTP